MVRWMGAVGVALLFSGCASDSGSSGSGGDADGDSDSTGSASTEAGDGVDGSTSSAATSGADSRGASVSVTTGEPTGVCDPGDLELVGVSFEVVVNRVSGDDIATPYDTAQGSRACVTVVDGEIILVVDYGPFGFDGLQSRLILEVADGVRSYDLAVDAGTPGSGRSGVLSLSYSYDVSESSTTSYGTKNQGGTGTVEVLALPLDGGATLEFSAQGTIAGADGWQFELTFSGAVAG